MNKQEEEAKRPKRPPKVDRKASHEAGNRAEEQEAKASGELWRNPDRKRDKKESAHKGGRAKSKGPRGNIDFEDARRIASIVTAVQSERKAYITEQEIEDYRALVKKRGGDSTQKEVDDMSPAQLLVALQEILQNSDIDSAPDMSKADLETKLASESIQRASSESEEHLTTEKVEQYLEIVPEEERQQAKAEKPYQGADEAQDGRTTNEEQSGDNLDTITVWTAKALAGMSGEEVNKIFKERGYGIRVSVREWDKADFFERGELLSTHKIRNLSEFDSSEQPEDVEVQEAEPIESAYVKPEADSTAAREPDYSATIRLENGEIPVYIYKVKGGRYAMSDIPSNKYDSQSLSQIIAGSGFREHVEFPPDWDERNVPEKAEDFAKFAEEGAHLYKYSLEQKKDYLKKHFGLEVYEQKILNALVWRDNNAVGIDEVIARLSQLKVIETVQGREWMADYGFDVDRAELSQRIYQEVGREETEFRLRNLVREERRVGTAAFNTQGLDFQREVLYDNLGRSARPKEIMEEVLDRLFRLEDTRVNNNLEYTTRELDVNQEVLQGQFDRLVQGVLQRADNLENFSYVYNFNKAIDELVTRANASGQQNIVDAILPVEYRTTLAEIQEIMNGRLEYREAQFSEDALKGLYRKVEEALQAQRQAMALGRQLDEVEPELFNAANQTKELPGQRGLVEWHTTHLIETLRLQKAEERETGLPGKWEDSLIQVRNVRRLLEASEASQDDVTTAAGQMTAIANAIPTSELGGMDKLKAERMKERIIEVRDAVRVLYIHRITMQANAMDAQKILESIQGNPLWRDDTYKVFIEDFNEDHLGREIIDADGHRFNLQSDAMRVFSKVFTEEKTKMRMIECLTLENISDPFGGGTPRETRIYLGRELRAGERTELENMRSVFLGIITDKLREQYDGIPGHGPGSWNALGANDRRGRIETHWANAENAEPLIIDWYRRNTLLGAHGIDADPNSRNVGKKYLDMRKRDVTADLIWRLRGRGVENKRIREYQESGLIDQVINNAYNLTWGLGMFSDYDGIRVWDRSKVWFKDDAGNERKQLKGFAFNMYSELWSGRMIDHIGEFLFNEVRGRPGGHNRDLDANYVYQKHMIGQRRAVLGHNRMVVKLINDKFRNVPHIADSLVAIEGVSFSDVLNNKMATLDNVKALNAGHLEGGTYDPVTGLMLGARYVGGDKYDNGWARGAAIEELLEDGVLTLENIDWSEIFAREETNIIKYNLGDWGNDRATTQKFFGAGILQKYLNNPDTKTFFEINSRELFYSTREIRIHSWMKLVTPAHFALGDKWKEWWNLPYKMSHAEKDEVIEVAVESNRLEKEFEKRAKNEWLKWGPLPGLVGVGPYNVENTKALWETLLRIANETKKASPLIFLAFLWYLIKTMFSQSQLQLEGK